MNEIKSILEVIRRMKTTVILILFVVFVLFYYKPLITTLIEGEVKKPDEVKKDINGNVLIQEMLNDLMLKYKADRACIFQFSNNVIYYDGSHRNHTSMSFEVCSNGVAYESQNLQKLPVSLYPIFLQEVMLDKCIYKDINCMQETSTRISLTKQGIKSLIVAPYFKDGYFVAYIGLDYVKDYNDLDFDYNQFKREINEIGKILTQ
jgi:hypothetical protein